MRVRVEFIQLHEPLFLGGINFGLKLYPEMKGGIDLTWDNELKSAYVMHKGKLAIIPNVSSVTLVDPSEVGFTLAESLGKFIDSLPPTSFVAQLPIPQVKAQAGGPGDVKRSAQVSSPITQSPKKPGRPAKFQGGENQGE